MGQGGVGALGETIRRYRLARGLTQDALAALAGDGMRQSDVSKLEVGRTRLPRRARLERVANALQVPFGELLAESGWNDVDAYLEAVEAETDYPLGDPHQAAMRMLARLSDRNLDVVVGMMRVLLRDQARDAAASAETGDDVG